MVSWRRDGLVHVYTGEGKGKTTAAFGLALRVAGHGGKVLIIQFMKERLLSGEVRSITGAGLAKVRRYGASFVGKKASASKIRASVAEGIDYARKQSASGRWDLLVLDEAIVAASMGLLPMERLFEVIADKHPATELVLTGRGASDELVEAADLVTEMTETKHPYRSGVRARKGIEY